MTDLTELDDELAASARDILAAFTALERGRGRRSRALAAYVVDAGLSAPATAVHARTLLVGRGLSEDDIRKVGVSEQTVRPAAQHARQERLT